MFNKKVAQQQHNRTTIISTNDIRQNLKKAIQDESNASVINHKKVILFILGMIERIDFTKTPIVTLGRFESHIKAEDQLDLGYYGAAERGVSRLHSQLEFIDQQLVITDLNSSNGTYVRGKRLDPNQPYNLRKGEEITLGRLPIQFISDH